MTVAMLTTNMARGGAETLVARLSIALKRRGWDVHVVSLIEPSAFGEELRDAGVPLHAPGIPLVAAALRRARPQILHCHMFHANVLGRVLRVGMPLYAVISTLHSTAESSRGSDRVRARDLIYRATDRLADATVAVSQAVADRHVSAGAVRRALVIPNGIDTSLFRPDAEARVRTRAELGTGNEFVWLAAGRLMWKKNFPALVRTFQTLDRGLLLIAGAGPQEEELRALAGPRVRLLGSRDDIPALLNAADGFVLSSVVEGLPLVLLEAAATGLPCVATNAGGVSETGVGLVVEESGLAEGMLHTMQMSAEDRRALGAAGRQRVLERYSMDAVVTQWETLYRTLARSI